MSVVFAAELFRYFVAGHSRRVFCENFYNINVIGTQNIIDACEKFGIRRLVYTSSPSVISNEKDLKHIDETFPYPSKHIAFYPATKMIAEKNVLATNSDKLWTLALRPHLIWGPNDKNLIPAVLEKAKINKLVKIGSGNNVVDFTFIEDCVSAHLCAADALLNNPNCRGKAYFISQGEPTMLWEWIDEILTRNNLPKIKKGVPYKLAYFIAAIQEVLANAHIIKEPQFTRFLIAEMATDHYFNIDSARKELGYTPKYTMAEAMDKTYPKN